MKKITSQMIKVYETYKYDWMNFLIIDNELTYHHIVKREDGGGLTFSNGALLTPRAHNYLHLIEKYDIEIYDKINEIFKAINNQKHKPSNNQKKIIDLLLLEFEVKNANKIVRKKEQTNKKKIKIATNLRLKSQTCR